MGSFGDKLKREREMRAITLEEIAEATKIGTRSLRALEEENFDQLPGGIFNKGFVRAYAKFLGIDEEQAVADYVAATSEVGNSTTTQMAALAEQVEQHRAAREAAQPSSGNAGAMIATIVALVVVIGIGFGGYKAWQYRKQQKETAAAAEARVKQSPPPVTLSQPAPASETATPPVSSTDTNLAPEGATSTTTSSAAAPSTSTPASSGASVASDNSAKTTTTSSTSHSAVPEFPITLTLKASKASWVQVKADGKTVYSNTIGPNDQQVTLHGKEQMQLVIGNAGGVEISLNGKPLGPLGEEGQTRKLTITPQGMQQ